MPKYRLFEESARRNPLSIFFYGGISILNLLQAAFTQLQDDEAYYWVYSRFLDWGYFDHPPMIGLLVKAGTMLVGGELGVRLLLVLMNTLTIYVTEKIVAPKNPVLFYAICLSIAALQLAGFWAVPDTPLLFFTALFFYCYKKFLERSSWTNAFLLGIVAACLLYSKYHGVLVIFFTFIGNFKILRQPKIYFAVALALLLFVPHLWWQHMHEWITFRFQFVERSSQGYKPDFTLNYILGQLLVAGPIAGFILLFSSFVYRPKTTIERVLKFNAVGILAFFLINTATRNIQANWTAPAVIPMIALTYWHLQQHLKLKKWLYRLLPFTLLLVLAARVVMIADILPVAVVREKFHSWKNWPAQMREKTQALPIVITNSYQRASMYWFYSGQMTYSLNTYEWRRNNYNYWPVEDSLLGKKVFLADIYDINTFPDSMSTGLGTVGFAADSNYHSFSKILVTTDKSRYASNDNAPVVAHITADIPQHYKIFLLSHPEIDKKVRVGFYNGLKFLSFAECDLTLRQLLQRPNHTVMFYPKLPKGDYSFEFAIECFKNYYTHNSYRRRLSIE